MQTTYISSLPQNHQRTAQRFGQTALNAPPSEIIPMHYHPNQALPQEAQRHWNHLASVGVGTTTIGALLLIGSRFKGLQRFIQKNIPEHTWQSFLQNGKKTVAEALAHRAWQIIGIGGLLQTVNRYETAANTNQPSKLAAALIATAQSFGFLFGASWKLLALGFVTSALIYAGEQNDIENSNHPDKRREWDLSRLNKSFGNHTVVKEVVDATKFIIDDIKNAFSPKHWQTLIKTPFGKNTDWQTPQSYQSALGVQFSTVSLLIYTLTMGLQKYIPAGLFNFLQIGPIGGTNVIGSVVPQVPVFMRAWENRDQVDGKLVIAGSPLITAGRLFQMIPQTSYLAGLGFVGDAIKGKGLALNSQKYLALLNQMRSIQLLAQRDPYITASTVLNMMSTSPDVMDQLRHDMGQPRLDFLIQLLKKANDEYQKNGTSLNDFLSPLLATNNHP